MINPKDRNYLFVLIFLSVLASTAVRAAVSPVAVPEVSECADTESVTNVVFHAGDPNDRLFGLSIELDACASNNVSVAFGCDANGNGALERVEMDAVIGWDSGSWFYHDRRAGMDVLCERNPGSLRLDWQLTLNSRKTAKSLLATDAEGTAFQGAVPPTMFDPSWNLMQVTSRGLSSPNGVVATEMRGWAFRMILR